LEIIAEAVEESCKGNCGWAEASNAYIRCLGKFLAARRIADSFIGYFVALLLLRITVHDDFDGL